MKKIFFIFVAVLFFEILLCAQDKSEDIKPGTYDWSIKIDDSERTYRIHIPPSYTKGKKFPIVISLHGLGGTGAIQEKLTGFNEVADKNDFVVVYPDGENKKWVFIKPGLNFANKFFSDDFGFVEKLIDNLKSKISIDEKKIYLTGISNGAFFAVMLAHEMRDIFAAIAPVSGTIGKNIFEKFNAPDIPMIYFHGTNDKIVNFNGGNFVSQKIGYTSAEDFVAWWTKGNNCKDKPEPEEIINPKEDGTSVKKILYKDNKNKTYVTFYKIEGGGHTWPGGSFQPEKLLGKTSYDISASELIWQFFSNFSKEEKKEELKSGNHKRSIKIGNLRRTYLLHIPKLYEPSKKLPFVIVLHGGGGTGEGMENMTNFSDLSDKENFIVVYPDAYKRHWNDGRGVQKYESHKQNIDDVGFISKLIDELAKELNIDVKRVYVTGASNGAYMTNRLAIEISDKIAAIGPVMATVHNEIAKKNPGRKIPVIYFHGTKDPLAYYDGGDIVSGKDISLSAEGLVEYWVERNGCGNEPKVEELSDKVDDETKITKYIYKNEKENIEVIFYKVEGGGHTWPGGLQYLPEVVIGKTSKDVNATELIWEFFEKYSVK